jgi:hypothetical protein
MHSLLLLDIRDIRIMAQHDLQRVYNPEIVLFKHCHAKTSLKIPLKPRFLGFAL